MAPPLDLLRQGSTRRPAMVSQMYPWGSDFACEIAEGGRDSSSLPPYSTRRGDPSPTSKVRRRRKGGGHYRARGGGGGGAGGAIFRPHSIPASSMKNRKGEMGWKKEEGRWGVFLKRRRCPPSSSKRGFRRGEEVVFLYS